MTDLPKLRFEDLTFRRMSDFSVFHADEPEAMQAIGGVCGVSISIRRGGKGIEVDADRPYEVLADGHEFARMTSSEIDRLFDHIRERRSPEGFERSEDGQS